MVSEEIQVNVHTEDSATIIDLVGDVTTFAEEPITQAYQQASNGGATNIVFNFRENDYINSAGIAILISIVTEATKHQQKLFMTGLSQHFQKIFRMVGLTQYVEIYSTVEEAIATLKQNLS